MRADSLSLIPDFILHYASRLATLLLLALVLSGCKTERESEDPQIIGVPPEDAYLGVEYSYNFGATDMDSILEYSLTNAPSWLALEDITNKARQGIIARGVPGITGGQREREDLGQTDRINLVANDGRTSGIQPFSIEVQENALSVVSQDYAESGVEEEVEEENNEEEESTEPEERPENQCEKPFTDATGEHSYEISLYNEDGSKDRDQPKTTVTRPVLVQVNLDQPSVTRIDVAFELRSNFDPERCDKDFPVGHQRCYAGQANSDKAVIGRDVVALGSGSGNSLPTPDYITYQQDEDGVFSKGVLTLEPGITECYVRLEVIDDREPEPLETFNFTLTEVRSGLAGLGPSNDGVSEPMRIKDNEPTVTLQTRRGGKRDVVNLGTETEYMAVIEGDRDEEYSAKIGALKESDATQDDYFILQLEKPAGSGNWETADLIRFPAGTDEVPFRVKTPDAASYPSTVENDRFILLGLDTAYQAGRSNHAAAVEDDELRININELSTTLPVGDQNGFIPTDMAIGQNGRVFIAGYDAASGNTPYVKVYNQKGIEVSGKSLYPRGISLEGVPVIGVGSREVEFGGEDVLRYEFAVAFGVEEDKDGNPTPGNANVVSQRWFFDTSQDDYDQDWQLINGSAEDDFPRWIGIAPTTGNVLVSGVSRGRFGDGDTSAGRFGSFVQRIDTQEDGTSLEPAVAWIRKAESASHDERVVGGGFQNTSPIVIGDSSGAVEGESQSGGKDAFFYSAQQPDDAIDVKQVGTEADENLADGFFSSAIVWLTGNSNSDYRVETEEGVKVLNRTATGSTAGFILGYTPAGAPAEAYLANDEADLSTETLRAAMIFDEDIIAAGSTTGVVVQDPAAQANTREEPAIFRRNRQPRFEDEDETILIVEPAQEWDQQVSLPDPQTGTVEALVNYRDDEITALVRRDSGGGAVWTLNLFDAEGDPVN